jgi:hypothetical protein
VPVIANSIRRISFTNPALLLLPLLLPLPLPHNPKPFDHRHLPLRVHPILHLYTTFGTSWYLAGKPLVVPVCVCVRARGVCRGGGGGGRGGGGVSVHKILQMHWAT